MKLCVDCRHCVLDKNPRFHECHAPQNAEGRVLPCGVMGTALAVDDCWRWNFCSTHRDDGWWTSHNLGTCGKRGRWWEPKEAGNG